MPEKRRERMRIDPMKAEAAGIKKTKMELKIGSVEDLPVVHANHFMMNFFNGEFFFTVLSAAPEPWQSNAAPNATLNAKPLARFVVPLPQWIAAVKSFQDQLNRLQSAGIIAVETVEEVSSES